MEVMVIDSAAFDKILDQLLEIKKIVSENKTKQERGLSEKWLDNQEVCQTLHLSKRTLQYYRDKNLLPYSKCGNKIYYRQMDLDKLLSENYNG